VNKSQASVRDVFRKYELSECDSECDECDFEWVWWVSVGLVFHVYYCSFWGSHFDHVFFQAFQHLCYWTRRVTSSRQREGQQLVVTRKERWVNSIDYLRIDLTCYCRHSTCTVCDATSLQFSSRCRQFDLVHPVHPACTNIWSDRLQQ